MARNRELDKIVGHNVVRLRVHRRSRQQFIVDKTEIDQSRVSRIENGDTAATDDELRQISLALETELSPDWFRTLGAELPGSTPTQNTSVSNIGENCISRFRLGQNDSLRTGKIATVDLEPYCGEYVSYAPVFASLSKLSKAVDKGASNLRQVDMRIYKNGVDGHFLFEYGKAKFDRGLSEIYFEGDVFASNDRLYLIGYDTISFLDLISLTLIGRSNGSLVGVESIATSDFFGARRVALQKCYNGKKAELPEKLFEWLKGADKGVIVSM